MAAGGGRDGEAQVFKIDFIIGNESSNCLFGFDSAEFHGDYRELEKYSGKGNKRRYYILMGRGGGGWRRNGHKSLVNECSDKESSSTEG